MRKLFASLAIAVLALASAVPAFADGPPYRGSKIAEAPTATPFAWSGLYLGMGVGWGHTLGDADIGHNLESPDLSVKSFGGDGWRVPIIGGFDYHFRGTPFVIGAFGTWNPDGWGDTKFSADFDGTPVNANLALTYSAGVRLGMVMANQTMIYTGYKHQWADLTLTIDDQSQSKGIRGHGAIVGFEMPLNITGSPIQATLALEGAYTRFESVSFLEDCPDVKVRPDDLSVMAFLKIRTGVFGGN